MRILTILCAAIALSSSLLCAQSGESDDPYGISTVAFQLKMNSGGRKVVHSWSQKRIVQLGDRACVAVLKILSPDELKSPDKMREYIPVIRDAFAEPGAISAESDRDPKVTLFLLGFLQQNTTDTTALELIRSTEAFVRQQTKR